MSVGGELNWLLIGPVTGFGLNLPVEFPQCSVSVDLPCHCPSVFELLNHFPVAVLMQCSPLLTHRSTAYVSCTGGMWKVLVVRGKAREMQL